MAPEILDANRPQPRIGLDGKFSFQYTVCAALLDGKVGIESFTDERRFRADMVDLLGKTTLVFDKNIPPDTSKMHIEVQVTLNDGTKHGRICRKPPGTWGVPIDQDQHRAKIRDCLGARLDDIKTAQALDLLDNLERLSAPDLAQLMAVLA